MLEVLRVRLVMRGRPGAICPAPFARSRRFGRLDSDCAVHGNPELLLAAEIHLSRLYRHMPEKELDLIQFAAGKMAQTRTSAPEIMRCKLLNPGSSCGIFHDFPEDL